jgi:hypothetical protein
MLFGDVKHKVEKILLALNWRGNCSAIGHDSPGLASLSLLFAIGESTKIPTRKTVSSMLDIVSCWVDCVLCARSLAVCSIAGSVLDRWQADVISVVASIQLQRSVSAVSQSVTIGGMIGGMARVDRGRDAATPMHRPRHGYPPPRGSTRGVDSRYPISDFYA